MDFYTTASASVSPSGAAFVTDYSRPAALILTEFIFQLSVLGQRGSTMEKDANSHGGGPASVLL